MQAQAEKTAKTEAGLHASIAVARWRSANKRDAGSPPRIDRCRALAHGIVLQISVLFSGRYENKTCHVNRFQSVAYERSPKFGFFFFFTRASVSRYYNNRVLWEEKLVFPKDSSLSFFYDVRYQIECTTIERVSHPSYGEQYYNTLH